MLKPELDAAVFGGECVAFPLGGSAYMIIEFWWKRCCFLLEAI